MIYAGFSSVSEYQVSAMPWVTASTITGTKLHRFPWVTRYFVLKNEGPGSMKVSFSETGFSTSNYFNVDTSGSLSLEVRVKELFLSGAGGTAYNLFAGLTTIKSNEAPTLSTASLPSGSAV